jgi:phage terminase large subunit-like protein
VQSFSAERRAWRTLVAVDPPGETAECGIVVGAAPARGRAGVHHAVVLADSSMTGPPERWGAQVVAAYHAWGAEAVVAETNQGADMVRGTIHAVDPAVPVRKVYARQSKKERAEPVAALYGRGWVHHVGYFADLEAQMTSWVPGDEKSPDRLDALVHLVTALLQPVEMARATAHSPLGRRID